MVVVVVATWTVAGFDSLGLTRYDPAPLIRLLEHGALAKGKRLDSVDPRVKPRRVFVTKDNDGKAYRVDVFVGIEVVVILYSFENVAFAALDWNLKDGKDRVFFYEAERMKQYLSLKGQ